MKFNNVVFWAAGLSGFAGAAAAANPFASSVVSYQAGTGAGGNVNANAAVGEPTRFTGTLLGSPSAVNPFNPSFDPDETVSVGRGGSLVLAFDHRVGNDAANPYGLDLLIFGNSFFYDPVTFSPRADALSSEGGAVEVSQDGVNWLLVTDAEADGLFPTLGYLDLADPFSNAPGNVLSDFTTPVDPAFAWQGLEYGQIIAGYGRSGGGAGIDIGALGLDWIQFVRISTGANAAGVPEIDAITDVAVPAPATAGLLTLAGVAALRRRRVR